MPASTLTLLKATLLAVALAASGAAAAQEPARLQARTAAGTQVEAQAQAQVQAQVEAQAQAQIQRQAQAQMQAQAQTAAQAQTRGPSAIDTALLRELIAWAAEHRGRRLPHPEEAPSLQALPETELQQIVCTELAEHACRGLVAAYEPSRQRIIYRATLDMRLAFDRSFIVHELVHWLQHRDGQAHAGAGCRAVMAAEREAYAAQNRYLHHHKVGRRMGGVLKFVGCPPEDKAPPAPR